MRNYLSEMLYALTSAYSRKDYDNQQCGLPLETKIGKLFAVFAWGLDMVQEQAEKIKLWDNLDNACGSVLDRYGANFGVKRDGTTDDFYRLIIKVKVLSQLSGGDTDTVINAAAEPMDVGLTDILLEDVFPAKIALFVDQDLLSEDRMRLIEPIAQAIKRILAAGVGMRLYLRTYRTYRHNLSISHGGATRTSLFGLPINENRSVRWELPVTHGGAAMSNSSYFPIGEDRSVRDTLAISHVSDVRTNFEPPPIGLDRQHKQSVAVANSAAENGTLLSPLVSADKAFQQAVPVTRGSYMPPALTGAFPDTKKTARKSSSGTGGAYTRTHIKPRRID